MFDEEQAQFVCDFLECLTCSSGVPLRLMDWQRNMITEFYGQLIEDEDDPAGNYLRRYQYLYLEIAKKNGKSEIAAGLGVYHLFADGEINGEVYVVAADRDNAGIVFAAAKYMVEQSPALKKAQPHRGQCKDHLRRDERQQAQGAVQRGVQQARLQAELRYL